MSAILQITESDLPEEAFVSFMVFQLGGKYQGNETKAD